MRILHTFILVFLFCSFSQSQNTNVVNDSLQQHIVKKGIDAYLAKDTSVLKTSIGELSTLYTTSKDSTILAKYYHYQALLHKLNYQNDSAYYYYDQSKNISKAIFDSLAVGRRLLSIAVLQRQVKDFVGSEINAIEALQYLEPIQSSKYLERTYNNLGLVSEELDLPNEALNYYEKALNISSQLKNEEGNLYILNNIGLLYQKQQKHQKAIDYFNKGLAFDSIKNKYPSNYALLLENLAYSNSSLQKKNNVLQQYNEVLNTKNKLKNLSGLSTTHINISNYYRDANQQKKAIFHANEALQYAKKTHYNKRWLEALEDLSELTTGKQSKDYLKRYIQLNDSLFDKERKLKNQFAKIRYETDKKEKENVVLKTDNEKKQAEITYHKQQQTIGWLLFAIAVLAFIVSFTLFVLRRKKLKYEAQIQKIEARDNERQLIAKSLHDEVAGDLRLLHQKLTQSQLVEEAKKLELVKDNVRNLSHSLSNISFDKVSFKDQVINLIADYFEPDFKILVNGLHENDWIKVNSSIKRLLYLSIRESIQNSEKHAQASKIDIEFLVRKKLVSVTITDNGIGFDTSATKKGIGLYNIQERVEELKGSFNIESVIDKGTKIEIRVPLKA